MSVIPASPSPLLGPPHRFTVGLGVIGALAFALSILTIQSVQFNVANYTTVRVLEDRYWPPVVFVGSVFASLIALCVWSARSQTGRHSWSLAASLLCPFVVTIPLGCYAFCDRLPPFALTWTFILGAGWVALRAGVRLRPAPVPASAHTRVLLSLILLIGAATLLHTRIQINFFEHFMLGHSDIGHFTEELKNCLAGRGLRSDSFENTRLGWHFTPLLYVLAPGYALCRSPVYLMVCGPLLLHLPAIPIYFLARRRSGSVRVAWLFAVAWLVHPSLSRMVYANTYGFAWIYMSVPLLAFMLAAFLTGRRRMACMLLLLVWMCEETTTAVTFGLGLCLAIFTTHRKTGFLIAVGSLAYFLLCVELFIPHFSAAGRYERTELFGGLGKSMIEVLAAAFTKRDAFFARLFRPQGLYYILTLVIPMALLPLRGWRITLAVVPTLVLILLLQNTEWVSIKFWHQATILPVLFVAGLVGAADTRNPGQWFNGLVRRLCGDPTATDAALLRGFAVAAVVCACLGHYLYGFSPVSRFYTAHANDPFLQSPDARLPVVQRLRAEIPLNRTVLATERLGAHFTDYRRLYTGRRIRPADFVVIDRSDQWDTSGLPARWTQFQSDPQYRLFEEDDSIIVFERRPDAPPAPPD
ncbi:MAG: DUF2079 domain-containing protein [Planctomycetota bacterium]